MGVSWQFSSLDFALPLQGYRFNPWSLVWELRHSSQAVQSKKKINNNNKRQTYFTANLLIWKNSKLLYYVSHLGSKIKYVYMLLVLLIIKYSIKLYNLLHSARWVEKTWWSVQFSSVAQSCLTLCDPMNHSTLGLPVHHQFLEFTQTHVHRVSDAIQPSHLLSSPSPPDPNPSQHQSLFQWVNSSHNSVVLDAKLSVILRTNGCHMQGEFQKPTLDEFFLI